MRTHMKVATAVAATLFLYTAAARADFSAMTLKASCLGMSFVDASTGYLLRSRVGGFRMHKLAAGQWDAGVDVTIGTFTQGVQVGGMRFVDATTGYIVGGDQQVFKSIDSGATWTGTPITVSGGQNRFSVRQVDFGSKTHGVATGLYGVTVATTSLIATTTDGGTTWTEGTVPADCRGITAAGMAGPGMIVIGGTDGPAAAAIWMSADGAKTWTKRKILAKGVTSIQFLDANTGFVVSYPPAGVAATNEQVIRTLDGAKSWASPATGVIDVQILSAAWIDKDNGFVGGRDATNTTLAIARTTNGGQTWTPETMPAGAEFVQPNDLMNCFDYPGPAAYSGTTNGNVSMLKNDTAGGARVNRYAGGVGPGPDGGGSSSSSSSGGSSSGATPPPGGTTPGTNPPPAAAPTDDGGGCRTASGQAEQGIGALLLGLLFLGTRRRRKA